MSLIKWLADRFPNSAIHHVVSVGADGARIHCARLDGSRETVTRDQITRVLIRTTDKGPFEDDVFYVLETEDGALIVPQEANGCDELLQYLQELPDFENEAVIEAMCHTDNREFLCWQRQIGLPGRKGEFHG